MGRGRGRGCKVAIQPAGHTTAICDARSAVETRIPVFERNRSPPMRDLLVGTASMTPFVDTLLLLYDHDGAGKGCHKLATGVYSGVQNVRQFGLCSDCHDFGVISPRSYPSSSRELATVYCTS